MELGAKIRQARLEAGLSQRQLCGDTITRNMLSQIENGSAKPSMDTLRQLAQRLDRPMSFFLEEQAVVSPNQAVMEAAREAALDRVPEILEGYRDPDPIFDRERWLLEALGYLAMARNALEENRPGYACTLLEKAAWAGDQTPYYTRETERTRLLLLYEAGGIPASHVAEALPDMSEVLMIRATAALEHGDPVRCEAILQAAEHPHPARWHVLMGDACMGQKDYARAVEHYLQAEPEYEQKLWGKLERCYSELEDYKMAYRYACMQRN